MSDWWNIAKAGVMGTPGALSNPITLDSDVMRVALIDNEGGTPYTFDNTHDFLSTVFDGGTTGLEFSGTGYSRQGLTTPSVVEDDANTRGEFDADDTTFASIDGATIAAALIYKQVGGDDTTPGNDPLFVHLTSADFPLTANGGDVTLSYDAEGIAHIT